MNNLDNKYQKLLVKILDSGYSKNESEGSELLSIFGEQFIHDMSDGFSLLTIKKLLFKNIVTELLWILRGDTNVKFLLDNQFNLYNSKLYEIYNNKNLESGNNQIIEDEDSVSFGKFLESLKKDPNFLKSNGDLGSTFGKQLRKWNNYVEYLNVEIKDNEKKIESGYKIIEIDQLLELIKKIRETTDSRSIYINCWNVSELNNIIIPFSIHSMQVLIRKLTFEERLKLFLKDNNSENLESIDEKYLDDRNILDREISLMWNQKETDVFSELPKDLAVFGLLLKILSIISGTVPGKLISNLGEAYIYKKDIDKIRETIDLKPYKPCELLIYSDTWTSFDDNEDDINNFIKSLKVEHFMIKNYFSHK